MKSKKRFTVKRALKFLGAGLLGLVVLAVILSAYQALRPDASPLDDSALLPVRPDVPAKLNGWAAFSRTLEEVMDQLEVFHREKGRKDTPEGMSDNDIRELEKLHAEHILALTQALDSPYFFFTPSTPDGYNENSWSIISGSRHLTRLQMELARRDAAQGNIKSAKERLEWSMRLNHALMECRGSLVLLLSAMGLQQVALDGMHDLIHAGLFPIDDLTFIASLLTRYRMNAESWDDAVKADYEFVRGFFLCAESNAECIHNSALARVFLKPNEGLRFFHPFFADMLHVAEYPLTEAAIDEFIDRLELACDVSRNRFSSLSSHINPTIRISRVLSCVFVPRYDRAILKDKFLSASVGLLRVKLAVVIYRAYNGALPPDLEALTPDYLDAVPTDPIDGKPLRYDAARGLVYSVGFNMEDNGGSADYFLFEDREQDVRDEKDLVLRIDPPSADDNPVDGTQE